jgi:hypothetical protein
MNSAQRQKAAGVVQRIYRTAPEVATGIGASELDAVLLLRAWFRKFPKEEAKLLSPDRSPFGSP